MGGRELHDRLLTDQGERLEAIDVRGHLVDADAAQTADTPIDLVLVLLTSTSEGHPA